MGRPKGALMTNSDPRHQDDGASAVEYALLVSLIAIVLVGALTLFGETLAGLYDITF